MLLRLGCRRFNWLIHAVGGRRLDPRQYVNVDVDSRRREISLGKRPVDCTVGSAISVGSSSALGGVASAVRPVSVRPDSWSVSF